MSSSSEALCWEQLRAVSERASAQGALHSLRTECEVISDAGIDYLVRRLVQRLPHSLTGQTGNPFLPHEPLLRVADVGAAHVALLNKFNVVAHHLLLITRDFVDQRRALGAADLAALGACMEALGGGLGFYNGGPLAGASQPHRHLQWVPVPLVPGRAALPVEAALEEALDPATVRACPRLPFAHRLLGLAGDLGGAALYDAYLRLLHACDLAPDAAGHLPPYNLLLTRRWMLLVPRCRAGEAGIGINALGYAGALLVRSASERERLIELGPARLLGAAAGPQPGGAGA